MPVYKAPLRDVKFLMHELLDAPAQLAKMPFYAENDTADGDLMKQVLEEAARFVEGELLPLNAVGDQEGCVRHDDGERDHPHRIQGRLQQVPRRRLDGPGRRSHLRRSGYASPVSATCWWK